MAREYKFICDGCAKWHMSSYEQVPNGWAEVHGRIGGFTTVYTSASDVVFSALICARCQNHLRDCADPHNWPASEREAT